ncbi:MAG TPA: M1 family metallopeptidase [Rubricoccaceae bacterium]|nr:M1 family metallopeptidase [Rubricoccaceae bacterium]
MRRLAAVIAIVAWVSQALPANAQRPGAAFDVDHYRFALTLSDTTDVIQGEATVDVAVLATTDQVVLDLIGRQEDGKGMAVSSVMENGQPRAFQHGDNRLSITLPEPARQGDRRQFVVTYSGIPADGLVISTNRHGDRTFFGDNWPTRGRHWLPTVDHPSDKATVEWIVTAPAHYQVVGTGRLAEETDLTETLRLTRWRSDIPLPTKVLVIGVARFAVEHLPEVDGVPLQSWVYPQDREAGFRDLELTVRVLDTFLRFLPPFPFEKLAGVQSKTVFGGMENATNIFYAEDAITGTGSMEALIAHEVAHQWFGNAVSETDWPHLWLSEGFATYLTDVYFERVHGREAMAARLRRERDAVFAMNARAPMLPVVDTLTADPLGLLNQNSYQKGAWVLHMLRRRVGDEAFFDGLRRHYAAYLHGNASTDDFRRSIEEASGQDLRAFFDQWLHRPDEPVVEVAWRYDAAAQAVVGEVRQRQPGPAFSFPLDLAYGQEGDPLRVQTVEVTQRVQAFTLPADAAPTVVVADPDVWLLASFFIGATE